MAADGTAEERVWEGGYTPSQVRHALRYIVVAWVFGAAFFAITTGPAFASFLKQYLQVDDLRYGLIMAAGPAASLFWFLGSYVVERSGRSKPLFMWFVTGHRLLWLVLAATPLLLRYVGREQAIWLVVASIFVSAAAASFGGVGWWVWMSTIVPRAIAGRYFGHRTRLGLLSMLTTMVIVSLLVDRFHGRGFVYASVFTVAALCGAADILLFIPVREAPRKAPPKRPSLVEILIIPWREPSFRLVSAYLAVSVVSYSITGAFMFPFCFAPIGEHGLGLTVVQTTAMVVVLPQLVTAWCSPVWGRVIDRYGTKSALRAGSLAAITLPVWWMLLHRAGPGYADRIWLLPLSTAFAGLTVPGIDQALAYMQLREFPVERRTAYTAAFQVVVGMSAVAGTTMGGAMAKLFQANMARLPWQPAWLSHYHLVFGVSLVIRLAAFVFLFARLPLPGRVGAVEVFRTVLVELFTRRRPAAAA
ncbi:MAG: MFS transporter [Armatimonadetes bacterium]|nr:MFS transporter [Armatimonadota bacterium]